MQEEFWLPIKGFEKSYLVSSVGRIKSLSRHVKAIHSNKVRSRLKQESILKPVYFDGYLRIGLSEDGIKKRCKIHRLVAEAFIPNPENKLCVNHINGIKSDNRIENLEWVTHSENTIHSYKIGTSPKRIGRNHPLSIKIKCEKTNKVYDSISAYTLDNNVSVATISRFINGKTNKSRYVESI